jgi:ribonucleotide reductase beta subunit family protein with ferritin-like domain
MQNQSIDKSYKNTNETEHQNKEKKEIEEEYLTKENPNRFVIFPIKHNDIWEAFQTHRKTFWVENEVDLESDLADWKKLSSNEQHFIKMVLAFFAASDGIVMENIGLKFFQEVQIPEARAFYSMQLLMESIHSIMYSQLIDTYISDTNEKNTLFNSIENFPSIKKKADWSIKYINDNDSFATRLIAFACVEGIFFSGSFCSIYWLNERGVMPGLCKSNEFIARDEGLHTDFACLLYKQYIINKLDYNEVKKIIESAVDIEIEFITESLPCNLLGMNSANMREYIKFVANRLTIQMGYPEIYNNVIQPFDFMNRICLENKTNFFEGKVSEYSKNIDTIKIDNMSFSDDCDF